MNQQDNTWYSGEVEYEGYPLHLRFPQQPDFDKLQKQFPVFLTITHTFDKVESSGNPESEYNLSLAELDHDLITSFEQSNCGKTVLVETYGGERNYYIYVDSTSSIKKHKKALSKTHKKHNLEWDSNEDPNWEFIREYSQDYKFYSN